MTVLDCSSFTEYETSNRVGLLDGVGMKQSIIFRWSIRFIGDGFLFNNWDPQMGKVIFYSSIFCRSWENHVYGIVCSILGGRIETSRDEAVEYSEM